MPLRMCHVRMNDFNLPDDLNCTLLDKHPVGTTHAQETHANSAKKGFTLPTGSNPVSLRCEARVLSTAPMCHHEAFCTYIFFVLLHIHNKGFCFSDLCCFFLIIIY